MSTKNADYMSVKEASVKFGISERRVQKLCSENRIEGAKSISGIWLIPVSSGKPKDERFSDVKSIPNMLSLSDLCLFLSISEATGRNWIKLQKITPSIVENGNCFFERKEAEKIKKSIVEGNGVLKSRRNKKYITGSNLYKSYISNSSTNVKTVEIVLEEMKEFAGQVSIDQLACFVIADCAVKLFAKSHAFEDGFDIFKFFSNKDRFGDFTRLIDSLLKDCPPIHFKKLFLHDYDFIEGEDLLGLLYISSKNIGERKQSGSYYTPDKVVSNLISALNFSNNPIILDPCCGTGNFLLKLPHNIPFKRIHGSDIDERSVLIARLNLAIHRTDATVEMIENNIVVRDFLLKEKNLFNYQEPIEKYDIILGNPPWGFAFSDEYKSYIRKQYDCSVGNYYESFSLFIERSIELLGENGKLSFVLPESVLNVSAHSHIRRLLISRTSVDYVEFLGNVFDNVQCPSIIISAHKTNSGFNTEGTIVRTKQESFIIAENRKTTEGIFPFFNDNEEFSILKKISSISEARFLKDNALFALGIVTGNNKKYVTNIRGDDEEPILKGSDIGRYRMDKESNFISFKPEKFQQVAPTEIYRAKEKLLYRFISDQLVFAYDDEQTLSLNSCNIVIPRIPGLSMKYVLAILNSTIAQFFFEKTFHSVKVLRSHIEGIPIPFISADQQKKIITKVNMISSSSHQSNKDLYLELDKEIAVFFGLSNSEYERILDTVQKKNLFI